MEIYSFLSQLKAVAVGRKRVKWIIQIFSCKATIALVTATTKRMMDRKRCFSVAALIASSIAQGEIQNSFPSLSYSDCHEDRRTFNQNTTAMAPYHFRSLSGIRTARGVSGSNVQLSQNVAYTSLGTFEGAQKP